jgi:hypothetical protein
MLWEFREGHVWQELPLPLASGPGSFTSPDTRAGATPEPQKDVPPYIRARAPFGPPLMTAYIVPMP